MFTISCDRTSGDKNNKPVARVYGSYLYEADIFKSMPKNYKITDSSEWINKYINIWIKRQLLLRKAELNLTEKQKDVSKELNEYRSTLIIHRYEEDLIKKRLDTIITHFDIELYYDEYQSEFRLKNDYVKTIFVKIPKSSPDFIKIKKWYKSDDEEDLNDLENFCFQNGLEFNFDNYWEIFNSVLERTNHSVKSNKDFLERNTRIERSDSVYRYFIRIKEYKLVNDISPLELVINDIRKIILNRRKIKLIEEVENNVFQEVLGKNVVEKFNL